MPITRRQFATGTISALALGRTAFARKPLHKILIVDGVNNHTWKVATAAVAEILTRSGLFTVDVSTSPPADAPSVQWLSWQPDFSRYAAVLTNFNNGFNAPDQLWSPALCAALERYVTGGGGLISYHAANNSFAKWPAYNQMIGLGWRPKTFGPSVHIGAHDEVIVTPTGEGNNPNHPPRFDFPIHVRATGHPITLNMPSVWLHPSEQLTYGQHGPVEGFTFLTYAACAVTGQNEPMDWAHTFGKGRVYTTMLGHTWHDEPSPDLECVGFQTLLTRGVEWAATGRVTLPIPADFPTPDRISLRPLKSLA